MSEGAAMGCPRCGAPTTGVERFCTACGTPLQVPAPAYAPPLQAGVYGGTQKWSELPPARRRLVVLLIGGGILAGIVIAASGGEVTAVSMGVITILGSGIVTVMLALRLILMWIERRQRPVSRITIVGVVLLMLIMFGLAYDAIVNF